MKNIKRRLIKLIPLMITIPPIFIGMVAMYHNGIPSFIWVQNIACLVIVGLISYFVLASKYNVRVSQFSHVIIGVLLMLIICTFFSPSMNGVHRWISIGSIRLNASMIVLPVLIVLLWELLRIKSLWITIVTTIFISILLAIQPDASQLTGFAVAMMVMLCCRINNKIVCSIIVGILSVLIILSWVYLDNLPPVSYVEKIMSLLETMGLLWLTIGVISLIILPIPFVLFSPKDLKLPSICVGIYFIVILISSFLGNFPVPLMGYGISPIIGYFIPITWLVKSRTNT